MSARRAFAYAAVAAAAYAAALLAAAPATWIPYLAERLTEGRVVVRAPSGTLWKGTGALHVREPSGALHSLGPLRWRVAPAGLAAVRAELDAPQAAAHARVFLGAGGVQVQGLRGELPAALLATLAPALEPWRPAGRIVIRSDGLQWSAGSFLGLADVEWRQAGLLPARGAALGSHVAHLRGGGSAVQIELETLEGPLRLQGSGSWRPQAGLEISGSLEHDPGRADAVARFLQGVCSEYRDGHCGFRIRASGS